MKIFIIRCHFVTTEPSPIFKIIILPLCPPWYSSQVPRNAFKCISIVQHWKLLTSSA